VRLRKSESTFNGVTTLFLIIRDYTDTVISKKINMQNEEDVGRIETINNEMKIVINKNQ
jgi:hypothetical protein